MTGEEPARTSWVPRVAGALALLALCALSFVLAVIGSFFSPSLLGVLIAVAGNLAVGVGGAWALESRYVPAVTGLVWTAVVLRLGGTGPGGDVVVQGSGDGVAFLVSGVLAVAVAVGVVTSRRWAAWTAAGAPLPRPWRPRPPGPVTSSEAETRRRPERDHARRGGS